VAAGEALRGAAVMVVVALVEAAKVAVARAMAVVARVEVVRVLAASVVRVDVRAGWHQPRV